MRLLFVFIRASFIRIKLKIISETSSSIILSYYYFLLGQERLCNICNICTKYTRKNKEMCNLELGTSLVVIIMCSRTCRVCDPQDIAFNTQWIANLNEIKIKMLQIGWLEWGLLSFISRSLPHVFFFKSAQDLHWNSVFPKENKCESGLLMSTM